MTAARQEAIRTMDKLADQWARGEERFDRPGAALFAAFWRRQIAGVGGMTPQPGWDEPAIRMQRFYVLPEHRGRGLGRALAEHCMSAALAQLERLTCNARASDGAAHFWEAMGFLPIDAPDVTHVYRCSGVP